MTGANAGIGYEICRSLLELGAHVVMVCRNETRGKDALEKIRNDADTDKRKELETVADLVVGDLGSINGVYKLGQELNEKYSMIHVLIHNAGVWPAKVTINDDGLEQGFMVNHIASFLLTHLLLDKLKMSSSSSNAHSRVVFVSGGLYVKGKFDIDQTPYGKDFGRISVYCNTKQASALTLKKWYEFLMDKTGSDGGANCGNVTIYMCHPGVANTKLGDTSGLLGCMLRCVKKLWGRAEDAAKAPIWLATSNEIPETKLDGTYWNQMKPIPLADNVTTNEDLADTLWDLSMKLTKLEETTKNK